MIVSEKLLTDDDVMKCRGQMCPFQKHGTSVTSLNGTYDISRFNIIGIFLHPDISVDIEYGF